MNPGTPPTRRLVLAAAGALLLPRTARAQMAKGRHIAILFPGSPASSKVRLGTFRQGLRVLGYGDDDIEIEIRYGDGKAERFPDLAAEVVRLDPEVIVTGSNQAIRAAKHATATIPIVIAGSGDPVATGFVASLARPGGNITGLSNLVSYEIAGKSLELLKTMIPAARRIAILLSSGNPGNAAQLQALRQAAQTSRTEVLSVEARTPAEIDGVFATLASEHAAAIIVPGDPIFQAAKSRIVELAASHRLPAIYRWRDFVAIGGLMSYGPDLNDLWRRAATYVDKILKGAKPADLPIEQPTKFELVVNLKTAKALGLTIPPAILAEADEVIE